MVPVLFEGCGVWKFLLVQIRSSFQELDVVKKPGKFSGSYATKNSTFYCRKAVPQYTKMSLDFDPSIPNTDTAVVQVLNPESLRPVSAGTAITSKNSGTYTNETVPWKSHDEGVKNELHLQPGTNYTGQLTLLSGKNLGRKARLHVSLASNGKIKLLHRTKVRSCDRDGISSYGETLAFQAPPEANLIFGATLYHLVLRDEHLGIAQIPLDDLSVNRGKIVNTNLGKATINFRLEYPIAEVEEGPESPELPSDYHYPEDDSQYEEEVYDQKNVVI